QMKEQLGRVNPKFVNPKFVDPKFVDAKFFGSRLFVTKADGLRVYDYSGDARQLVLPRGRNEPPIPMPTTEFIGGIKAACISPERDHLAIVDDGSIIHVWDFGEGPKQRYRGLPKGPGLSDPTAALFDEGKGQIYVLYPNQVRVSSLRTKELR